MDDTKRYTIQIKGTAYKFAPLSLEQLERVKLLSYMDVSDGMTTRAVMGLLKTSLGADTWDGLADRFVCGEVPLEELETVLEKLLKRTLKDAQASADAK